MYRRITTEDVTYLGVPARVVTAYVTSKRTGERIVVCQWHGKAVGQKAEHPAGTITYKRISGSGRYADHRGLKIIEPERTVTMDELPEDFAEKLGG